MELEDNSLLPRAEEQETSSVELTRSAETNLLSECHSEVQGAVIIYDTASQEIVQEDKNSEDPNNFITLHASNDVKSEPQEEMKEAITAETAVETTKTSPKTSPAKKEEVDNDTDDDETIATFLTSTGQQLALYAVEDSDEIFAVALYDESGEPPTNFHFLMKADVERLIGEGAVKTVKKPQVQPNKDPKPVEKKEEIKFERYSDLKAKADKEEIAAAQLKKVQHEIKTEIVEVPGPQPKAQTPKPQIKVVPKVEQQKTVVTPKFNVINRNVNSQKVTTVAKPKKPVLNVYQPRITEVKKETKVAYVVSNVSNENQYVIDNALEDLDSDAEIIEQSTVQYILCDGDPSDSEMTFDELQASLQSFKSNKSTSNINKTRTIIPQIPEKKRENIIRYSSFFKTSPKVAPILSQKKETVTTVYRTYSKGPKKARMTNNLLHPIKKIKQEVMDSSYGDNSTFDDGHMSSDELSKNKSKQDSSMTDNSSPSKIKVKRSRKQQLTMVNRTDSEIIIQPVSAYSEEKDEPVVMRKRGRRKKKASADPDYNPRKPIKKAKKANRSVEVIEIDVDESERSGVHDSTLESNKGKGSSDKENDVISVDDSGHEEEEEAGSPKKVKKPMMQCTDCSRNFRKRKALEKHVQVCPKSPAYIQKMEERKQLAAKSGKRFKCKSCDEMFDIAVALARHVRVIHSLKKKSKLSKGWSKIDMSGSSESDEDEEDEIVGERTGEGSFEFESGRKKRGRPSLKRSIVNESPSSNIELKLDSSTETLHQEPKRRGRPPGRKSIAKERSLTPDLDEKEASATESPTEKHPLSSEPRRRGRPRKRSISKERSLSPEPRDKSEDIATPAQLPKKRGRPAKRILSKDEEPEAPETEEKGESFSESEKPLELTPRRRGRPSKASIFKDDRSISPAIDEKTENSDEVPLETRKKVKLGQTSIPKDEKSESQEIEQKDKDSDEMPLEARKVDETSSISNDDALATVEAQDKSDSRDAIPLETRTKVLARKSSISMDDSSITPQVEEKNDILDKPPLEDGTEDKASISSISKDRSLSPEVKAKTIKVPEEKSNEARPASPKVEKKKEEANESKEQPTVVSSKETTEEVVAQASKEKPIAELPKKRKLSKDESSKIQDPIPSKIEDKADNTIESSIEPRKRGRPAKSRSVKGSESEVEDKIDESIGEISEELSRKRTRSTKDSISVDEELEIPKTDVKSENNSETTMESRKRGKPGRVRLSVEEETDAQVAEKKSEITIETSTETRKRGRPSRVRNSVDEEPEVAVTEEKEKPMEIVESTTEIRRRGRSSKDIPSAKDDEPEISDSKDKVSENPGEASPEPPRKVSRLGKERPSKDDELEPVDADEKIETVGETPRRRGRQGRDRSSKSESIDGLATNTNEKKAESPTVDDKDKGKMKKKVPSPNRTWKVKKLNCEDCGKWFSSATLLKTHRLQHRTKKSARLDADRCPLCRKAIPGDLFAKHMTTVHKKSPTSVGVTRRLDARRVVKSVTKSCSSRTLRSSS